MTIIMNPRFFWAMATPISRWDGVSAPSAADRHIKIYKGTMPTDADDYLETDPTYTADELADFTTFSIRTPTGTTADDPLWGKLEFDPITGFPNPSTVNASATGTAAWWAMYMTTGATYCMLGDISLAGGTGTLQLDSLSLVSGNPTTLIGWGVKFQA